MTLYLTPVVYTYMARMFRRPRERQPRRRRRTLSAPRSQLRR